MMHIDQRKQQYSFAYVRAIGAVAGYTVTEPSVDDDSIDLMIASRSTLGTTKKPKLELQAKCLGDDTFAGDSFDYQLKLKNYDDLRIDDPMIPRILVVVRAPKDDTQWVEGDDKGLLLRHCGYWCSIRGNPPYAGDAKKGNERVSVPLLRANRFDVAGLRVMMENIAKGKEHWP